MNRPARHPSEIPIFLITLVIVSFMMLLTIIALLERQQGLRYVSLCLPFLLWDSSWLVSATMANLSASPGIDAAGYRVPVDEPTGQNDALDQIGANGPGLPKNAGL